MSLINGAKLKCSIDIGRQSPFGNPKKVRRGDEPGSTLSFYRSYLKLRLQNDPEFRREFERVMELVDAGAGVLSCPGCETGSPTCHGRVMEEVWRERQLPSQSTEA